MKPLLLALLAFSPFCLLANTYTVGSWQLEVATANGMVSLSKNGNQLLKNSCGVVRINGTDYHLSNQTSCTIHESTLSDAFGTGKEITVAYSLSIGGRDTRVTHIYYLYANQDYILTRLRIQSPVEIKSNYMAPVSSTTAVTPLPGGDRRNLFIPFDNDEWVRYNSYSFGNNVTSSEVGLLYNATTMEGLVLGSIEHTDWKTGITANTNSNGSITALTAFAGHSDSWTRDALPHGSVKGNVISSSLILLGYFSDWRTCLETYGDANTIVAPKRKWETGKPFIWNSWGVLQTKISYMNAGQSALFMADSLVTRGYHNDSTMYMDLDSYWDNMNTNQLQSYTNYCGNKGLKTGIYWTPFVDWANNASRAVEGSSYKYSDIWLYANGQPIKRTGATACDPTHPGTKARAETFMRNFHTWGYAFLKLDFMIHGILEADSWYDPNITTGVQAYNYGMHYIDSLAADMYLNLSIAPLFPAHFANGRRIACDAYASVENSEYTLNSTTYGWWLDHVYSYNDGDNIVFKGQTIGVNRIRLLSVLITGIPCLGDDFSNTGDETAKTRAKQLINNPELMQMARQTKAFRPFGAASGTDAATQYYTQVEDTVYVALFNFTSNRYNLSFSLTDVGLQAGKTYTCHELMRDDWKEYTNQISLAMPRLDCYVLKLYPYQEPQGLGEVQPAVQPTTKMLRNNQLYISRQGSTYNALGAKIE